MGGETVVHPASDVKGPTGADLYARFAFAGAVCCAVRIFYEKLPPHFKSVLIYPIDFEDLF